ncbi:hypothetical protein ACYTFC_12425 [Streptomyces globosus]|nr:hypothetical protein [Streptomyces sp. WAC05292]
MAVMQHETTIAEAADRLSRELPAYLRAGAYRLRRTHKRGD